MVWKKHYYFWVKIDCDTKDCDSKICMLYTFIRIIYFRKYEISDEYSIRTTTKLRQQTTRKNYTISKIKKKFLNLHDQKMY